MSSLLAEGEPAEFVFEAEAFLLEGGANCQKDTFRSAATGQAGPHKDSESKRLLCRGSACVIPLGDHCGGFLPLCRPSPRTLKSIH
jgi:hypothetical protein